MLSDAGEHNKKQTNYRPSVPIRNEHHQGIKKWRSELLIDKTERRFIKSDQLGEHGVDLLVFGNPLA